MNPKSLVAFAAAGSLLVGAPAAIAAPGAVRGPSSSTDPYVLPVAPGVRTTSIVTTGDAYAGGYRFGGIPDGLGVYTVGNSMHVLANHEIGNTLGVTRRHGAKGAYVEDLTISRKNLAALAGRDLMNPGISYYDYVSQDLGTMPSAGGVNPRNTTDTFTAQTAAFSRFCSSTLSAPNQLINYASGRGTQEQVYFANEESGDNSRVMGVLKDGTTRQLPRLGLFSWENTKPAYTGKSDVTMTMGLEDGGSAQVWAYQGKKTKKGDAFDKAGLTNGHNTVLDVDNKAITTDAQFRSTIGKGTPAPVHFNEVDWDQSGAKQNTEAAADGLSLTRIEDGSWDPRNPNDFYFVTTSGGASNADPSEPGTPRNGGGLWRLRLDDVKHPEDGGTLTLLLDGSEAPYLNMPDNVEIDTAGNILLQEDPGGNPHVSRIIAYRISDGARGVVAQFDPALFAAGAPGLITTDEESSGIIDAAPQLGAGTFLFDAQVHKASSDPELVEGGQLLALSVPDFAQVYTIGATPGV